MKEAIIYPGPKVDSIDTPMPIPQDGQVLIRVVVCGSNPKDVKSTFWLPPANLGDDIAGYVESVGPGVFEFSPGDRVAAFHEMFTPHGAFAEYAIAWAFTTFRLPGNISFEEAATIPLTAMTAALGLYRDLSLPYPWTTDEDRPMVGPLVIYGAGAAVGSFAVQLARKSNVHPCVAGESKSYVAALLNSNKGDAVIDYREGPEVVVAEIKKALGGRPLLHAFDSVGDHGSDKILGAILEPENSKLTVVLPKDRTKMPLTSGISFPEGFVKPALEGVPQGVEAFCTAVGAVHGSYKHFGYVFFRYFALGLAEGWLKPLPHEVLPGGLNGLADGLAKLLQGKAHAVKYVYRIGEAESLQSGHSASA